uniref:RHS repeat-associated core domain-containing protein n=1 Tax=Acetatifactor sp. TaxID=1872090 RepID=UPI004029DA1C
MKWHRYGNATNAEENNSQNQCGILFPVQEEVSATEADLIARIKTTGKEKNYELIEYLNDVNREHAEVLVEQNINGKTDTSYIYGAEINGGFDRISLDRFDGSTGYYLYDARGSVSGITNEEGQVYQSYRYSVTGEITFGAPQYENEYTYNGESYNPNIESQYLRARYYCVVTATFLTEDSYLGSLTEPLTLNRYNYCVSSYLNYTDPSGNEVEVLESLKGWIIDPDTQAQKTIENYENQRLSLEDAIESGLLNNRAGQIFLDYGDIVMGPAVKTPADIIVIRETVKGNSDSKEMQRTATAGFYAGFVGQGIEYTQIISNADYQLSMIITSAKGVNSINNPLSYLLFIKDFSLTQTIDAAKAGLQDVWNGTYDSAIGRKIGAGTFNYLLMTIGGAQLKGKGTACEAVESGSNTTATERRNSPGVVEGNGRNTSKMMYGTDKNAGVIPKEIADKLREKQYNNFDEFRNDFWKAVAETDYANEFLINGDPKNYYRMKNGGAPLVVSNQAINGSFTYQLHHIIPINQGGSVYSVDNLVVVTPRYHAEILIPEVHGYNGFKQFFR